MNVRKSSLTEFKVEVVTDAPENDKHDYPYGYTYTFTFEVNGMLVKLDRVQRELLWTVDVRNVPEPVLQEATRIARIVIVGSSHAFAQVKLPDRHNSQS